MAGIRVYSVNDIDLNTINFKDNNKGLEATYCKNVLIQNSGFSNNSTAISLAHADSIQIVSCVFNGGLTGVGALESDVNIYRNLLTGSGLRALA